MAEKVTTATVCAAMAKRWASPEYAIMWEINESTGTCRGRAADAVIMSLWPSRGLELHGVEIKVSRADYRREAADPAKAEAVANYCDRWWLHVAPGVIDDLSAVPPAWGVRMFDGKAWTTLREAERTEAAPISRPFLAAMLRRADGIMASLLEEVKQQGLARVAEAEQKLRENYKHDVNEKVQNLFERKTRELSKAAEAVAKFEAAFGADVVSWQVDHSRLGAVARLLASADRDRLPDLARRLRSAATLLDELSDITSEEPAP